MSKIVRACLVFLLLLSIPGLSIPAARAEPAAEFFAAPAAAAPGAEVVFSGWGFTPNATVDLYLMTTPSQYLGTLPTSDLGEFAGALTLPLVDAGLYQVMVSPNDVFADVSVQPAMTLDLSPAVGPPGTLVHFIAGNLQGGRLRLDYAGLPVYGPVDVSAGLHEGDFLVPADRPVPLGTDAELLAVNLVGSQVVGAAQTFFISQPADSEPYAFQNVEMPVTPINPGETFTILGEISPPPVGPLSNFALNVLWKTPDGQVAPIMAGAPALQADGAFTVSARAPSLLAGDPFSSSAGGQVGLVFYDLGAETKAVVSDMAWLLDPPAPVFIVKVVDTGGNPIQGALVDVRAFYSDFSQLKGETTGGEALSSQLSEIIVHPNQVTSYLGSESAYEADPFTCEQTNVYGRTNAQGEFAVQFDPDKLAMMGEKIFLGNLPQPVYAEVPMEITFPLYVNALHQGFGTVEGGLPTPYVRKILFSAHTNRFYDAQTNALLTTNPLVVTLPALPAGTQVSLPITPKVIGGGMPVGGFKNYLGTGIPMAAFGKFYSFPFSQYPDAWFTVQSNKNLHIEFQHDPALFGALEESNLKFTLQGQIYPFVNMGKKYDGNAACQAVVYRATIPNFYRFAAGNYTGMIELHDTDTPANITRHYLQLNFVSAPAWILQPKILEEVIYIDPNNGLIYMEGSQYTPDGANSTSALDTNVPKVGPTENRAGYSDEVVEILYPDKTSGMIYRNRMETTAVNESAAPVTGNSPVGGKKALTFGPDTVQIMDTGKIPLFRDVFGIWPIASATIGADMWIEASLTYDGKVEFLASGATQSSLLVMPEATVGVDAWFDLSALFGLVSANAHAIPQITLKMPARFEEGSLDDAEKCFLYRLDIQWSAKVGECPLCYEESDTENIFDGANPDPCTLAPGYLADNPEQITVETPPPPTASPALAVDGFGHTLLVWSDEGGNLQSRSYSGGTPQAELPVTVSAGSIDPQVTFYAPNKAVAVWTESSLTAQQSGSATLAQMVQAQHLQYALWDGASWSAAQNLTLPADANGEGGAALAGCLSGRPGCPAGGAATVVWLRDASAGGDLSARQFRLYYATFSGGVWSTPQAVDPASTATDAEPTLAYQSDGVALLVWTRDADRDPGTLEDRRLAKRALSAGQPVTVEAALPAGAFEPSLALNAQGDALLAFTVAVDAQAMIGNQRQLHAAQGSCAGPCTWSYQALIDANGRIVHAESPVMSLNAAGQAVITYRALGFGAEIPGGAKVLPGDALGTVLGTGEMAQAVVNFASNSITPSYLTNAGNTVWQTVAAFDPLLNQIYVASSQGSGPALPRQALAMLAEQGYPVERITAVEGPVAFIAAPAQADISIYSITPSSAYIQPGIDPWSATVSLLNNGGEFRGSLEVRLTWDGPAGLGDPAGEYLLGAFPAGSLTVIEFSTETGTIALPAFPHLPHTLYVEVNPAQTLPESDYGNNMITLAVGGLPAPRLLSAAGKPGSSAVFLEWALVEHEAVRGYRVYRSADGRAYTPVGGSFGSGFVDFSALAGQSYFYVVVAYGEEGYESAYSNAAQAVIEEDFALYLPLVRR